MKEVDLKVQNTKGAECVKTVTASDNKNYITRNPEPEPSTIPAVQHVLNTPIPLLYLSSPLPHLAAPLELPKADLTAQRL